MARPAVHMVRPSSGPGQLLTLVPLATGVAGAMLLGAGLATAALAASTAFLAYRLLVVRMILCRDQRRGVLATRAGRFEDALVAFRASESFWSAHRRLDRWRAPLLGSAGAYSFHLLARYNQAFCLSQLGRGGEALAVLDEILADDPDNALARPLKRAMEART